MYTSWSVVFGEQPTAAKWNQLGANDAAMKDGTGIDNDAIIARHILQNAITGSKLATNAITLGYAEITSDFFQGTTTSNQWYDIGVSVTFTVPAGGRKVKATAFAPWMSGNVGSPPKYRLGIRESTTVLAAATNQTADANEQAGGFCAMVVKTLAAGTYTWKVSASVNQVTNLNVGASNDSGSNASPAFLLIELI